MTGAGLGVDVGRGCRAVGEELEGPPSWSIDEALKPPPRPAACRKRTEDAAEDGRPIIAIGATKWDTHAASTAGDTRAMAASQSKVDGVLLVIGVMIGLWK
jgi:hypothetical protein